jgi:hypothetical protein
LLHDKAANAPDTFKVIASLRGHNHPPRTTQLVLVNGTCAPPVIDRINSVLEKPQNIAGFKNTCAGIKLPKSFAIIHRLRSQRSSYEWFI